MSTSVNCSDKESPLLTLQQGSVNWRPMNRQSDLVQITADNQEISRRISAFVKRKQMEVDAFNRREFCRMPESSEESTCARTDATYIQRRGKKSLIEVTRIQNVKDEDVGTSVLNKRRKTNSVWSATHPAVALHIDFVPPAMNERISAMERHVEHSHNLDKSKKDVYERIAELESRILYLEGLSPEYFSLTESKPCHMKRGSEEESQWEEAGVEAIDDRIAFLRKRLLEKKSS